MRFDTAFAWLTFATTVVLFHFILGAWAYSQYRHPIDRSISVIAIVMAILARYIREHSTFVLLLAFVLIAGGFVLLSVIAHKRTVRLARRSIIVESPGADVDVIDAEWEVVDAK